MGLLIDLQPSAGPALVVGGGTVAARKVRGLVEAGFDVVIVAPEVLPEITRARVEVLQRAFAPDDIASSAFAVVFACTSSREVNRLVGELAREQNIPVVVADAQEESTFFSPAVLRDGDLAVAVSTGGASPALARDLRERIAQALGDGWAETIEQSRAEREQRLGKGRPA